ncbi:MAG: M20 family metallopeptidase [Hyphomicrobiaceae bacterium]|jgi:glutamate carboxypeptidase
MTKLAPQEKAVTEWLASQKEAMLGLLAEVVNIDSGSYDKAGVDAVGERFIRFFGEQGLLTTREPNERFGDAIHIRLDDKPTNERPIVLMGHRDTVFPKGEVSRRPFRVENGRAYGPGVVDMKSGLVLNAFVLAAFKRFGGAPAPLAGLITSDEEIASPSSRPVIERVGRAARCVFNSEPGRPSGNIVTGRKGGVFLAFEIAGKAAHSGGNFEKGISAIAEMAHKIVAMHKLTDLKQGVTVNVGLVKGGQSVNTTAPSAEGQIDLRYVQPEQRTAALAALQKIIDNATVPGTTAKLEIKGEFLPVSGSTPEAEALFSSYQAAAADAGLKVAGEFSGGCADSGFTSAVGCPTLCGVGPVGGNAHTPEEYLEVETLVPRAQAMALAILRLPPAPDRP